MMGRHGEKTAVFKPRREASEETNPADALILDFWVPGLRDNELLWLTPQRTNADAPAGSCSQAVRFTTAGFRKDGLREHLVQQNNELIYAHQNKISLG